jgi:hypothetical protein
MGLLFPKGDLLRALDWRENITQHRALAANEISFSLTHCILYELTNWPIAIGKGGKSLPHHPIQQIPG